MRNFFQYSNKNAKNWLTHCVLFIRWSEDWYVDVDVDIGVDIDIEVLFLRRRKGRKIFGEGKYFFFGGEEKQRRKRRKIF